MSSHEHSLVDQLLIWFKMGGAPMYWVLLLGSIGITVTLVVGGVFALAVKARRPRLVLATVPAIVALLVFATGLAGWRLNLAVWLNPEGGAAAISRWSAEEEAVSRAAIEKEARVPFIFGGLLSAPFLVVSGVLILIGRRSRPR